mmetsp:Transcript_2818/g.4416  ORF Transcript_2818/g.4416 Transcript_2818/m.4416 type:complete len:288 (+) Transcript_2818:42-905(+)|eukprot:CAMPEP_0196816136 /NCGR_PEP_ID=MMETSP1362-20130617/53662_1 /TAXON_ID=163516 /ORGANISM="Leptocylindrus danicus, Strain CCMP1856" /LENGTH=287 /DNA_ID=CAMNT_0042193353 /DNA_START=33 /DNA_END=896 /DNA_ORIENTATION=+
MMSGSKQQLLLLITSLLLAFESSSSLPVNFEVARKSSQCIFDWLEEDERVTLEVFMRKGDPLQTLVTFKGPVSRSREASASALMRSFESNKRAQSIDFSEFVDFEKPDRRSNRRQGEPFKKSFAAKEDGWYNLCVNNERNSNAIAATMDFRKSSELGMPDALSGHIMSYETRVLLDNGPTGNKEDVVEEKKNQIDDTAELMDKFHKLGGILRKVRAKQSAFMYRLDVHKVTNEHTHSKMVVRSLIETLVFMAVTAYQVFQVRRWFTAGKAGMLGSPMGGNAGKRSFY